ncbi:hypothetical protein [Deinococcus sonorensis]|uniref:Uncharacterized protein n=2 Tax=Deinococcus sonorensis TaxID=309891 RepID=A0AAU7UC10_9DEIO
MRQDVGIKRQASQDALVRLQLTPRGYMIAALDELALGFGTDRDQTVQRILKTHFSGFASR